MAAAVFFVTEIYFFRPVLHYLLRPLCKEQKDIAMRESRTAKAAHSWHKFFYFTFATLWGYYVLKDEEYMPTTLGGTGSITVSFSDKY